MHGLLAHSSIYADSTSMVQFLCGYYGRTLLVRAPVALCHASTVILCWSRLGRLRLHDAVMDRFLNVLVFKVKSFVDKVASTK